MKTFKCSKAIFAVILLFLLCGYLHASSRQRIESALESARRELRISIATEEQIASELKKIKLSGGVSPDLVEDYEHYLNRVQAMVAEQREMVEKIEALNATYDILNAPDGSEYRDDTEAMMNPPIPEEEVEDEVAVLDRELDRSLSQFDEMLLKQLDLIRAKSSERMQDLAEEAAAAVKRLRDRGIEIDTDVEEESADSVQDSTQAHKTDEMEKDASQSGKEKKSQENKDDGKLTDSDTYPESVEGSRNHPKNRYDPKDDDIVARQLREAAEEESDPELRKKLWEEYENYKENKGK